MTMFFGTRSSIMSTIEMTEVKQEDLLTSVLLRVTNLDKNATLLECMLDEKNIIITLCFTIINTFEDNSKHLVPFDTIEKLVSTIQSLSLSELIALDNHLSLHSTTADQLIQTKKTETLSEAEDRRHTHWIIKSLTVGFISISILITAGIMIDLVLHPKDNSFQLLINVMNGYKDFFSLVSGKGGL